jgi:hypothetical protein
LSIAGARGDVSEHGQEEDQDFRRRHHYCQANWSLGQDRELPNLLSEFLHKGRLESVIEDVLHLTPK